MKTLNKIWSKCSGLDSCTVKVLQFTPLHQFAQRSPQGLHMGEGDFK